LLSIRQAYISARSYRPARQALTVARGDPGQHPARRISMSRPTLVAALATALAVPMMYAAPPAHAARTFECGGVGRESQERMVTASDRRDMMLTFATESGTYLADVDVLITSPSGVVLARGHCDGPLLLVDLPMTGTVQVHATWRGQTQRKPVTIGKHTARVAFIWNAG
jgi:hypothetical protein